MDKLGLLLLLILLLVGIGLYLLSLFEKKGNKKTLPGLPEADFETAGELFPSISFPPEVQHEFVPEPPPGYNDNSIVVMTRDPDWIYAYWELSPDNPVLKNLVRGNQLQGSPVLRVYDVTEVWYFEGNNSNSYFDVPINDSATNWYINVSSPNRRFCVDLGRVLDDGTFVLLARSNYIYTPRNTISDKTDPEWMLVSENERKVYGHIGHSVDLSSLELNRK